MQSHLKERHFHNLNYTEKSDTAEQSMLWVCSLLLFFFFGKDNV